MSPSPCRFKPCLLLEPQKLPGLYGFPLLTLLLTGAAILRARPAFRFRLIAAAVTLAALVGVSIWLMRGAAAANMVAAPLFPVSLALLWPARMQGRKLLLLALLASPASIAASGLAARPLIDRNPQAATDDRGARHSLILPYRFERGAACGARPGAGDGADRSRSRDPGRDRALGLRGPLSPQQRRQPRDVARRCWPRLRWRQQILADRRVDYIVLCRGNLEHVGVRAIWPPMASPHGLTTARRRISCNRSTMLDPSGKLAVWRVRREAVAVTRGLTPANARLTQINRPMISLQVTEGRCAAVTAQPRQPSDRCTRDTDMPTHFHAIVWIDHIAGQGFPHRLVRRRRGYPASALADPRTFTTRPTRSAAGMSGSTRSFSRR